MTKKRYVVYAVVFLVLAVLVYLQFRTWQNFDWARFRETRPQKWNHVLHGIALIYLAYVVRAIRWKIFLRPVRPQASSVSLVAPTIIGFTGLHRFRQGGFLLVALVAAVSLAAVAVHWKGEAIADWVERRFSHLAANLGHKIATRIREFRSGLNTIHNPLSLLALIALSLVMWFMIIMAYQEVAHSYGVAILNIRRSQVLVLMGASMIGSMAQLPGIGGGSQLATIATLHRIFDVPPELAASCGIMLWLVTFVAVVPVGLLLSHHERLSLERLTIPPEAVRCSRLVFRHLEAPDLTQVITPFGRCGIQGSRNSVCRTNNRGLAQVRAGRKVRRKTGSSAAARWAS